MMDLALNTKVFLALGATDMRKAINGLSVIISEQRQLDVLSGHLFVFCNRQQTILKILYWDRNGFCLFYKRLEKDIFRWPNSKEDVITITKQEFSWLMDGLEIYQKKAHKSLKYSVAFIVATIAAKIVIIFIMIISRFTLIEDLPDIIKKVLLVLVLAFVFATGFVVFLAVVRNLDFGTGNSSN